MKDLYAFPAVFHEAEDGISIHFPDLPGCLPCAATMEEAFLHAKEALQLHLYGMEEDKEPIPAPSRIACGSGRTRWRSFARRDAASRGRSATRQYP